MIRNTPTTRSLFRGLSVAIPVLFGGVLIGWSMMHSDTPGKAPNQERAKPVAVMSAPSIAFRPRAKGYGEARPAQVWRAVPEVAGTVIAKNPSMARGAVLHRSEELFAIDPRDYELAVLEAEAAVAAKEAEIGELELREDSTKSSLIIERRRLAVSARELERQQALLTRGTVPQATVDRQEREHLQQQQAVQDLENILSQLPAELRRANAELSREQARLAQANINLQRTVITAPMDLRVGEVLAEEGQVIQAGEILMHADSVAATEVEAEVPLAQFVALFDLSAASALGGSSQLRSILPDVELKAEVRLRSTDDPVRWAARVDRLSDSIDPRLRTAGVIVVVDRPYEQSLPAGRPPLVKGMYVEVLICAPQRAPQVVVPRSALHDTQVYVANANGRLEIRDVTIDYIYDSFVVLEEGLDAGEQVILTDLIPAIDGMLLEPENDAKAADALAKDASGREVCA